MKAMRDRNKSAVVTVEHELFQRIEKLEGELKVLERSIWILENPLKFERGEIAEMSTYPYTDISPKHKVEVLDTRMPYWNYGWIRKCQIRMVNGKLGGVQDVEENDLIKIEKTVRAKS